MKKILLLISAMFGITGSAFADVTLSVDDVTIPKNGEADVVVRFSKEETDKFAGWNFQLQLPEGLSFLTWINSDNEIEAVYTPGDCYTEASPTFTTKPVDNILNANYFSTNTINGQTGILVTFRMKVTGEFNVGDVLSGTLTEIGISDNFGNSYSVADASFTITIGEPTDGRIVFDEKTDNADALVATGINDVRVYRTINANEWSTIVLPFAMTEAQVKEVFGDDVQLADFTGYDVIEESGNIIGITVNFDEVTAIEANHPYIIKVGTAVTEFTVDGVNIEPEDAPCVAFGSEYGRPRKYHPMDFVGTYTADFDFFNDAQSGHAIFLSGGKFWYATASTRHMKAFRAYFDFDDILTSVEEASGAIEFKFDFDDATGIKAIDHSTIDHYYNLSGQRVGKNYKGIVVTKGKKVLR